ncbi:MAG: VWA domain-containing protein [Pseudomonadota bacterium]
MSLPRAVAPFVAFAPLLRANGFAVAPEQTMGFIEAVGLLGPRDMMDIRRAGLALLAIPHGRKEEYHRLFDAHFLGQALPVPLPGEDEDAEAREPDGGLSEAGLDSEEPAGQQASMAERLGHRDLRATEQYALTHFSRHAPKRLPRRRSRRFQPARSGSVIDMRQTLRMAVRRDGEILNLAERQRRQRQRRIVLMIDVSGSMAERTEESLILAHALANVAERAEVFTLGTRLTRVTPALKLRQREAALERAGATIADIDGGTRIGEALQSFLAVPRFAGFARGAYTLVLSDGLERGSPDALTDAVVRLARLVWRLDWLTPLADADYAPRTEAMRAILPHLHSLGDGRDTGAIVSHLLDRAART